MMLWSYVIRERLQPLPLVPVEINTPTHTQKPTRAGKRNQACFLAIRQRGIVD
jgi:hypothetical protein